MTSPALEPWHLGDLHGWQCAPSGTPKRWVVAVAGPPTSGLIFRQLRQPLARAGYGLRILEPFHPPPPSGHLDALADRLAPAIDASSIVLGHGLGNPLAIALAARRRPAALCLLNGAVERLDPVSRAVVRWAAIVPWVTRAASHPRIAIGALASSAGLRRAVVNPYAMDRDTVAMLSMPLLTTRAHRRATTEYLGSLSTNLHPTPLGGVPVVLIWGTSDLLYPIPRDPSRWFPGSEVTAVSQPGGRFLAIEERPWEVSDLLVGWAEARWRADTATKMS
jgi:hypothetical protein